MSLSKEQEQIVRATEDKIVVCSCAASGKTTVLTERIKYLLEKNINPKEIVAITFTNAAAEEISERLNHPSGVFIGTIHGYANYLLLSAGIETAKILSNEQFNRLFEEVKKHPNCIKFVDYLLLDEAQDSNEDQFTFILDMIKPRHYMFVGDLRQSIYRWNGSRPDILERIMDEDDVVIYDLDENYRNARSILRFAKSIIHLNGIDYDDHSIPMRDEDGRVIETEFSAPAIVKTIKKYGHYKDWFILTRTNDQLSFMVDELKRQEVPCDTFKRAQLDNKELNSKIKEDTVKVLTIHTAKGLEAKYVVVIGAKFFNVEEKCVSYVAATRARDLLVWTTQKTKGRSRSLTTDSWE